MRLSLIILVLCYSKSKSVPASQEKSEWKQSRFIIDNRKNILFSHKSFYPFYQEYTQRPFPKLNETSHEKFYNSNSYQRDLSAESRIVKPNYYPKYNDKPFLGALIKNEGESQTDLNINNLRYIVNEREFSKNTSNVASDNENFVQNIKMLQKVENEKVSVAPTSNTNIVTHFSPSKIVNSHSQIPQTQYIFKEESHDVQEPLVKNFQPQVYGVGRPTRNPFTWEFDERKNGRSQTEKNDESNEKHVYETRIETVSYHKEIILNPDKTNVNDGNTQWAIEVNPDLTKYQREEQENVPILEKADEKNQEDKFITKMRLLEKQERNYKESVINYVNSEKSHKEPERNYEEPEKNYEEPEKNYEEPEKNYEEPERNYEEPVKNYEEPEKNYEEPERNYEEPEKNYEELEGKSKNNEEDGIVYVLPEGTIEAEKNKNKFGYVEEGNNFKRYRVEERTPDGFIVGEYGIVSHDDGSLRGVRYTAEGTINPQLIYDSLIKFLSL